MRGRGLVWAGAAVAVAAPAGLGVYLARVGLQEADQVAGVLGSFVAVAGLGVAVWRLIAGPRTTDIDQQVEAGGNSEAYQAGRDIDKR
jgi:high-affinity Fe2+/Pb2+ permease